jgi:hypothetical protein
MVLPRESFEIERATVVTAFGVVAQDRRRRPVDEPVSGSSSFVLPDYLSHRPGLGQTADANALTLFRSRNEQTDRVVVRKRPIMTADGAVV